MGGWGTVGWYGTRKKKEEKKEERGEERKRGKKNKIARGDAEQTCFFSICRVSYTTLGSKGEYALVYARYGRAV